MDYAQTATGRLSFAELGRTLIHEHVKVGMPGWQFDHGAPKYVRAELLDRAVDQLQELQAYGCNTIVDPCPIDIGRDVEFIAEVAQRSDLATGRLSFAELGRTLIHEHVKVGMPGWQFDHGAPKYVRAELLDRAVDQLQELQAYGCNTIVDPCPIDIGRDVEFIAEVAQR